MTFDMGNTDKLAEFRAEAERLGIKVDPPSINRSDIAFEVDGNTIGEVLAMTQYDWRDLEKRMKAQIDAAIKQDILRPNEGMRLLQEFERGLKDQTYLSIE